MSLIGHLLRGFGSLAVPSAPALIVVDNGNNTGALATISGSTATAMNTVYVQSFDGELGTTNWTSAGSRIGDGTLHLSLTVGHRLAYVNSTLSGVSSVSSVVYFVVTDGLAPVHLACLTAAQARIQALLLDGVGADSILVAKIPLDRNLGTGSGVALPAILLAPERETVDPQAGVNSLDDVGYGVMVTIVDRDNQEPTLHLNLDKYLLWREKIVRAFRNQRLPGVPGVMNCVVEPAEVVSGEAWSKNLFTSALVLRFVSREPRGLS
jgi:hypothetical protein